MGDGKDIAAELASVFGSLTPAQASTLQSVCSFSRPTLESVQRQTPAKQAAWLAKAKAIIAAVTADESSKPKRSKSDSPSPPP